MREHDAQRQRGEEIAADAVEEDDGEEDDGGGEGGGQHGQGHFARRLRPRLRQAASPSSMWRKMFSSTTTELSMRRENTSARPPSTMVLMVPPPSVNAAGKQQCRKRDGQQHGDGGARAAEEDQDHEAGEHEADAAFVHQVSDGSLDEDRLVEDDGGLERFGMSTRRLTAARDAIDDLRWCCCCRPA